MASISIDDDVTWSSLESSDYIVVLVLIAVALWPYVSAIRYKTSISLATVLSLLLVMFTQFAIETFEIGFYPVHLFSLIPAIFTDPSTSGDLFHFHRFVTAAWLHADFVHVLGNVLVIALAGVPLEQRMGPKRWFAVYLIGLLGGNLAWIGSHPDSSVPAIGASGAAFGILGAYMACWPEDKIEFPLLFLIRAWPVWLIAFFRLGLEVFQIYSIQSGTAGESNVAHMAHVGGFFIAYLVARPIAKGGPSELFEGATIAGGFSQSSSIRRRAKESMGGLESDPWERADKPLQGRAARILVKLRAEGDELETRRAWLEELAENTVCPICNGEIIAIVENESCTLRCGISPAHIEWP
ncbi:MAG TPA: rhomboid family intramembrane serine protease [Candidatus Thalassarchaeaceae archaeon]|jgi:membrane associated rhomboid family serine protease|nr:rhomboid family intramembrane serine protease [Candidatus Thalassarchaeaceae archaeon]|tara:strand:+ start:28653 stop:29714 length:1062 start_codon:yes stop_codon:yes gene_type:complete